MILTLNQLAAACGARIDRAQLFLPHLIEAMGGYEINTPTRAAYFLANIGHETMGLKYTREIWGPTAAQDGYEGREDLGNTQPGDGYKMRGAGLFHHTGRANIARVRDRMRKRFPHLDIPDFEADPDRLTDPRWAAMSAADYVDERGMNALADAENFLRYCVKLNGRNRRTGLPNGWDDRQRLLKIATNVLK